MVAFATQFFHSLTNRGPMPSALPLRHQRKSLSSDLRYFTSAFSFSSNLCASALSPSQFGSHPRILYRIFPIDTSATHDILLSSHQASKEPTMEWTAPQHEEIDLNCEISSYANAEL